MAINASVSSPADVVNLALVDIGHEHRVGNLYDGSKAATAALDIYSQTRDQLLRDLAPTFSQRQLNLTLLKSAPVGGYFPPTVWSTAYPPLPWLFEYQYPTDCLKFGALFAGPLFIPDFDPKPKTFNVVNDNAYDPAQKVIVTNVADAIGNWVAQVTDPTTWDATFVEAMAAELGRRLIPLLGSLQMLGPEAQVEQIETMAADRIQG